MNSLKIFENIKFGKIRVLIKENKPWFIAKDVCDILEIRKHRAAVARLDDDERGSVEVDTLGGKQNMVSINEYGLYSLVLSSRKTESKEFKRWITHDVIPQIRKTGSYNLPKMSQQEILIATLKEQEKIVERVDLVEQKLDNQMTIDHAQQRKLQKEIALRVYVRLKENYLSDYKEDFDKEKRKLFSQLHREIKDRFAVSSYTDVRIKDFSSCLNYIKNWIERKD